MKRVLTAAGLRWEEEQRVNKARGRVARRAWFFRFAFAIAMIFLAVGVGTVLARMGVGSRL